jgi:hypothetical protein
MSGNITNQRAFLVSFVADSRLRRQQGENSEIHRSPRCPLIRDEILTPDDRDPNVFMADSRVT